MKTLHLTLKKKWFDMIASGEKLEEYRDIKSYWIKRLVDKIFLDEIHFNHWLNNLPQHVTLQHVVNNFNTITFKNGYQKDAPTIIVECKGIEIGKAKPEWSDNWQGDVFIIKIGKILTNQHPTQGNY